MVAIKKDHEGELEEIHIMPQYDFSKYNLEKMDALACAYLAKSVEEAEPALMTERK